jgi:putative tryptophan/tyrosine transport system substrate-binding protein
MIERREFITLLGGAAAWPLAGGAQQPKMPLIGVLLNTSPDDPENPVRITALGQALQELSWTNGRNLRIEYRFAGNDADRTRRFASELAALTPDVVLAEGAIVTRVLQQASRKVPIVFVLSSDPVGEGLVASLARPGGNTTGFALWEYGIGVKWLQLLKEIAPNVTRAAVVRDRGLTVQIGQFGAIQGAAPLLGVELSPIDSGDATEIEGGITAFAGKPNGGLIVPSGAWTAPSRELFITLAARHRLPAVYPFAYFVTSGGLMSYGPDTTEPFRSAADYIDRILKGTKPADLPVQYPTRYKTVLNMKTAKALGLAVPPSILLRADEVIE